MSLKDLQEAAEQDKANAGHDEVLMTEGVGLTEQEAAHQVSHSQNHEKEVANQATATSEQPARDTGNVVDMQGKPLTEAYKIRLAKMTEPDRDPTPDQLKFVADICRRNHIDLPENYEKSFNTCRAFLDEHAYVIQQEKAQGDRAAWREKIDSLLATGLSPEDVHQRLHPEIAAIQSAVLTQSNGVAPEHGKNREFDFSCHGAAVLGEFAMEHGFYDNYYRDEQTNNADDFDPAGAQGDQQQLQQQSQAPVLPQQPMGPVSGVGAAIGAIAGLGAGIIGLSTGLVNFPFKAGKMGLQTFRKANMENALDDAHKASGHFTETVSKLMAGHATQEDVLNAYNDFQNHYKSALNNITKVGVKALEEEPEKLAEVRHKIAAIKENAEVNGFGKLEQDSRFKELGEQLNKSFESVIKFFENMINRIFGRQVEASPSI